MREAREAALGALRQSSNTLGGTSKCGGAPPQGTLSAAPGRGPAIHIGTGPGRPPYLGEFDPWGQMRARRLSFLWQDREKRNGGCKAQPSSWLKSPPPARAGTPPPRAGGALTPPHRGQRCPHNHSLSQTPAARSAAPGGFLPSGGIRRWAWTGTSGR